MRELGKQIPTIIVVLAFIVIFPTAGHTTPPSGYVLTFSDEFDGTSLNTSNWYTRYIWGGGTVNYLNDEVERFTDNGTHVVSNGTLKLIAKKTSTGTGYESGMIRSNYWQQYGYFEARIKMPNFLGEWPTFWLASQDTIWPPEIDILEAVNNGSDTMTRAYLNVHGGSPSGGGAAFNTCPKWNATWGYCDLSFDMSQDFHVYGLLWTPTQVTMYIDDAPMATRNWQWLHDNGTSGGPAHVLIDLAIGGSWAGRNGIDSSKLPAQMEIDYVRVYASDGSTPLPPPPAPPPTFAVGARVQAVIDTPVRNKPTTGASGKIQCTQPAGALGTIASGPKSANDYTWWSINFDTGCDGWTTQDRMGLVP
jgi:beta-glucanase (GH16 family)